jgi:outer membrane protein assembly factor BamB
VYATTGISKKLLAIQPSGNVAQSNVAWSSRRGVPSLSSPIIIDDLLFMVTDDGGIVTCLDALIGKQVWRQRLGGNHWGSPVYADGNIYFTSKEGKVTVLTASKSHPKVLATNQLNAEFIASPAVAGDSLVLRSTTHLYCLANGYQRSVEDVAADVYPKRNQRGKNVYVKEKSDVDWETSYKRLLKINAELRDKVESGRTTKEDVIEWMMKSHTNVKKSAVRSGGSAEK